MKIVRKLLIPLALLAGMVAGRACAPKCPAPEPCPPIVCPTPEPCPSPSPCPEPDCSLSNKRSYNLGYGKGHADGLDAGYRLGRDDHRYPESCKPWTNSLGQEILVCGTP